MKERATIVKGSFWVFLFGFLTKIMGFIYTVIVARLVSPEEIGAFYLALSILSILYIFTDFGLLSALCRYIPYLYNHGEVKKLNTLIRMSYLWGGGSAFVFSALIFLFSESIATFVGEPAVLPILKILSIWLFIKEIDDINRGILEGRKKLKESRGTEVVQNIIKIVLTVLILNIIGFKADALSIAFLLSFLLTLPLSWYLARKETKNWEKHGEITEISEKIKLGKEVLYFGVITTTATTFVLITQYIDRLMIGYLMKDSLAQIAVYSIAAGLAAAISIFPGAITGIFSPVIAELYGKGDMKEIKKTTVISMKWMTMLMIPPIIMLFTFGDKILNLFYGPQYATGSIVLILFTFGIFVRYLFSLPSGVLSIMLRLDVELKASIVAGGLNILLNLLLIPRFGINGAALASVLSFIGAMTVYWYYSKKVFNFKFPKEVFTAIVAGAVGLVVLLLLKETVLIEITKYANLIQIGSSGGQLADVIAQKMVKLAIFGVLFLVSCVVYFLALLGLRAFGKEEISLLEAGLKKVKVPEKYIKLVRTLLEAKYLGSH